MAFVECRWLASGSHIRYYSRSYCAILYLIFFSLVITEVYKEIQYVNNNCGTCGNADGTDGRFLYCGYHEDTRIC
jgi:hypothetical protein